MRELLSPARGRGLDVRRFIGQGGSLFLIADQQQAAEAVPVLTALAEHFLRTAQDMANDYRRGGSTRQSPWCSTSWPTAPRSHGWLRSSPTPRDEES
ncbi:MULTISPECIES: hypothetical protein [unclassified Pseudonocardia]|uniref:hypothetical protein n=1 Tax=unclassified Pseudonocardia TaxID=2619320 RepID=UPI0011AE832E|nr:MULTISPECIES: hypothetical protein [unclassified Pseudonocardia]